MTQISAALGRYSVVKSLPSLPRQLKGVLIYSNPFVTQTSMFDDIANELNGRMRIGRYVKRRGLTRKGNVFQF